VDISQRHNAPVHHGRNTIYTHSDARFGHPEKNYNIFNKAHKRHIISICFRYILMSIQRGSADFDKFSGVKIRSLNLKMFMF